MRFYKLAGGAECKTMARILTMAMTMLTMANITYVFLQSATEIAREQILR